MDRRLAQAMIEFDAALGLEWMPAIVGSDRREPLPPNPVPRGGDSAPSALEALEQRHAAECTHCLQATGYRNLVFGEGNEDARLMFVGEAPGADEDRLGRPFVGRAGELLDRMIAALKLDRSDVYIANVLKSRPPDNRNPTPEEAARCGTWLARQIDQVDPEVIVTLGAIPTKFLLDQSTGITKARGIWGTYRSTRREILVMPTFHPAYVLRQYTPEVRGAVWNDLQQAKSRAYGD